MSKFIGRPVSFLMLLSFPTHRLKKCSTVCDELTFPAASHRSSAGNCLFWIMVIWPILDY